MPVGVEGIAFFVTSIFIQVAHCQVCEGNGFTGGCSSIFELTGKPEGLPELLGSDMLAEVCEGDTIAVLHDCRTRLPLYVSIRLDRTAMDTPNPGRCDSCDFVPSSHLDPTFQAVDEDYDGANDRIPCYERQTDGALYRDQFWTGDEDPDKPCLPSLESPTGTSRGHMIADSYITAGDEIKDHTYRFTNCVPQFQKFNSESWNIAEQKVFPWASVHCGSAITDPVVQENAFLHLMVGIVPSAVGINVTFDQENVSPRWFGTWGFGDGDFNSTIDYNGQPPASSAAYRLNMPASMWTAACCVGTDASGNVAWVRHMAFGRDAKPVGNDVPVFEQSADSLFRSMLPELDTANLNLFPNEPLCSDISNYVPLSSTN